MIAFYSFVALSSAAAPNNTLFLTMLFESTKIEASDPDLINTNTIKTPIQSPVQIPIGTDSYKIVVSESGIYELSYDALKIKGMNVDQVDPTRFEMMHMGRSVAYALTGDGDAQFEAGESVIFYGWAFDGINQDEWFRPLPIENTLSHDKLYVDENIYWLWADGSQPVQIASRANATGNSQVTTWRDSVLFEEDYFYDNTNTDNWHTYDYDATPWFWASIASDPTHYDGLEPFREYDVEITDPVSNGEDATLVSHVFSSCASRQVETHLFEVSLNGDATTHTWRYVFAKALSQTVSAANLLNGTNKLRATNVTPKSNISATGGRCAQDGMYTDIIRYDKAFFQYDRALKAVNNELIFTYGMTGTHDFVISNVSEGNHENVMVWDVTDRRNPSEIRLRAADIAPHTANNGLFTWTIGDQHGADAQYIATTSANFKQPDSLSQYNARDIAQDGVEWIAISHVDFMSEAERLAAYRTQPLIEGIDPLTAIAVDIEDVVNQYGYGYPLPQAIQVYLTDGYTDWANGTLRYVALFGDGSTNPRQLPCTEYCGSWGNTHKSFIPTDLRFYDRFNGLIPMDHTYANLVDDDNWRGVDAAPELAVGRFAANTLEQAKNMVDKVILYEQNIADDAPYLRNLLFISDNRDVGGDFCKSNRRVSDDAAYVDRVNRFTGDVSSYCLDTYMTSPNYELFAEERAALRADIFAELDANSGNGAAAIVNYRGHGGRSQLGGIINAKRDHAQFTNTGQPVVWISADCLDGDFAHPSNNEEGLSEQFMRLGGLNGTAGHWSSTGLGFDREHTVMHQGFYEALYGAQPGTVTRIGDAIVYAKTRYLANKSGDVSEVWSFTYQGDPAMIMPFVNTP